jgi:hypothetical protein
MSSLTPDPEPDEGGPPEPSASVPARRQSDIEAFLGATGRVLISDADRGRVADVIGDAFAEGRLTHAEYDERLTVTMAARTLNDLMPVVEGLPPAAAAAALAPLLQSSAPAPGTSGDVANRPAPDGWYRLAESMPPSSAVAIFGGATRKGEWLVPEQLTSFAMFGGVELDLTRASFAGPEAEFTAVAVFGGVDITVPEGITVQVDGIGIFGGFDQQAEGPGEPGAPVLRIKGVAFFGGVSVKRKRRKGVDGKRRPELTN